MVGLLNTGLNNCDYPLNGNTYLKLQVDQVHALHQKEHM